MMSFKAVDSSSQGTACTSLPDYKHSGAVNHSVFSDFKAITITGSGARVVVQLFGWEVGVDAGSHFCFLPQSKDMQQGQSRSHQIH